MPASLLQAHPLRFQHSPLRRRTCLLRRARPQAVMSRRPRALKLASACVRATSILSVIRDCRATRAENSASSTATTACLSFRTPTPITSARSPSTFTPYASPHANCGANKPHNRIPSTLICGTTTLTQHDPIRESHGLAALPQLPPDAGGPVFAEPCQAQAFALPVNLSSQGH